MVICIIYADIQNWVQGEISDFCTEATVGIKKKDTMLFLDSGNDFPMTRLVDKGQLNKITASLFLLSAQLPGDHIKRGPCGI